mmetsp:Transcript_53282/g.64238  ORF Transcript_53282/g.64238 Transcript_53282/m.64238 type:complete len:166 (-) Transcript_53282:84-581(-)|eukprot:CAMPEP_0172509834 /NCGR_PEP_ID=MMETSP1066-20121228/223674_1 /TAXON_ID=671091 /ORGANISM="Coscinodiscus wailesii, Strain CCMP2513" /LENGTH=165 /DNA_ID=CAMNT_0013288527 /DNA_START=150 /DNA_END=647 /DNA_ORIENTATION=+
MSSTTTPVMRSALRKLCKFGESALKPQKVNDRWRPPLLNGRDAARVRKDALKTGTFGSFDANTGVGWDPAWDLIKPRKIKPLRAPKGHKRERTREDRAVKIEKLLEGADDKIEAYRKEFAERKVKDESLAYKMKQKMKEIEAMEKDMKNMRQKERKNLKKSQKKR